MNLDLLCKQQQQQVAMLHLLVFCCHSEDLIHITIDISTASISLSVIRCPLRERFSNFENNKGVGGRNCHLAVTCCRSERWITLKLYLRQASCHAIRREQEASCKFDSAILRYFWPRNTAMISSHLISSHLLLDYLAQKRVSSYHRRWS